MKKKTNKAKIKNIVKRIFSPLSLRQKQKKNVIDTIYFHLIQ